MLHDIYTFLDNIVDNFETYRLTFNAKAKEIKVENDQVLLYFQESSITKETSLSVLIFEEIEIEFNSVDIQNPKTRKYIYRTLLKHDRKEEKEHLLDKLRKLKEKNNEKRIDRTKTC